MVAQTHLNIRLYIRCRCCWLLMYGHCWICCINHASERSLQEDGESKREDWCCRMWSWTQKRGWVVLNTKIEWLTLRWLELGWLTLRCLELGWLTLMWLELGWLTLRWLELGWLTLRWLELGWLTLWTNTLFYLTTIV